MKRITSFIIAVILTASIASPIGALGDKLPQPVYEYVDGTFEDVQESDWYYPSVKIVYEYGLMQGASSHQFDPQGNITIAESIALASRFHSIYANNEYNFVQGSPWYDVYVHYAIANGIIVPGEFSNYSANATRAQFAKLIASAIPDSILPSINDVPDNCLPDVKISDNCGKEIYTLYRAGILTGNDAYGTFTPNTDIGRSAVAAIISRVVEPEYRQILNLKSQTSGIQTLNDLENYLNENMGYCTTPMGTYYYDFTVRERIDDFVIETAHTNGYPWYKLMYDDSIPSNIKTETLSILRDFQRQVYQIASEAFPNEPIAGGFCDWGYRYPNIKVDPYVITALSWANHSYTGQDTSYSFYWDTSRDWYDFNSDEEETDIETDITTIKGLENYLNDNFGSCETPMGFYSLKFSVEENSYSFNGWDIEIKTEGNYCVLPWAAISSSIEYSEAEKEETLNIFRDLQKEIYEIASSAFPGKKLTGCYFSDWYKYPSLDVGYETSRHLTWTNYSSDNYSHDYNSTYITSFHWDNWRDDTIFE